MDTIDEINSLIAKYNFPLEVLQDVNHRLECCKDDFYVKQQLRYLNNLINAGLVSKK